MQNHSQSISSSRELLPSTSPSQEMVIGRSWLTGESFWLKLSFRKGGASDWHSCVGMADKQSCPEHWKSEAHHRQFYWHWISNQHCAEGRTYCGGKVEERRKEVAGLVCEFPLPCAQGCLNSNQAQGAWLSMRALVQAVTQKGNLSWSGVWSGHFEVISFSKEIISFVCTCSGKLPHWRLFWGHLDHNCFVQKSSMTGNEKKKNYKW